MRCCCQLLLTALTQHEASNVAWLMDGKELDYPISSEDYGREKRDFFGSRALERCWYDTFRIRCTTIKLIWKRTVLYMQNRQESVGVRDIQKLQGSA